jgi:hypothetical protein
MRTVSLKRVLKNAVSSKDNMLYTLSGVKAEFLPQFKFNDHEEIIICNVSTAMLGTMPGKCTGTAYTGRI